MNLIDTVLMSASFRNEVCLYERVTESFAHSVGSFSNESPLYVSQSLMWFRLELFLLTKLKPTILHFSFIELLYESTSHLQWCRQ